ncbi:hypothetical protein FB645_000686 [Coemansia sp. IMI 203386]|nr:hypothetical protein FB645_000686 [Coemansia sp. IMI 203386]
MDTKTTDKKPGKRGAAQIVVLTDVQVPHMARITTPADTGDAGALGSNRGMSRAQLRSSSHQSPSSVAGSPIPLATSRTTDHFHTTHSSFGAFGTAYPAANTGRTLPFAQAPSYWDESLTSFLSRMCSPHSFGLESLSIWHDEMARIKIPLAITREQWVEAEGYIKYLAQQLAANNALTGNLNSAMFHFVVHMRSLKTVDFLGDIDAALCSLQFVLRIILKGFALTMNSDRLRKVLADRPIASGTIDLIIDKQVSLDNGEVRIHAFKQTLADSTKLYQQLLHYVMLAIARIDVKKSSSMYAFYQDLTGMVLDLFVSQVAVSEDSYTADSLFVQELVDVVGPSRVFNIESTLADECVRALLINAIDPATASSSQGLVQSAYSYLFSRQNAAQTKTLEQHCLFVLLLLISTLPTAKDARSPYLETIEGLRDLPENSAVKVIGCGVSFRKLFTKLVSEIHCIEWTTLFQILISRNDAFRTYALARTDADTLIVPLLKKIGAATALPIPSSFSHSQGSNAAASGGSSSGATGSGGNNRKRSDSRHYPPGTSVYTTVTSDQVQSRHPSASAWALPQSPQLGSRSTTARVVSSSNPHPSPSIPSVTGTKTAGSTTATTTAPANNNSNHGSTGQTSTTPGYRLRQSANLPYALIPETVPYVHLYLWLDILLALSSDTQFVEQLQRSTIDFWPALPHPLHKPPLSHCIIVESMRIFQLNIMLLKDSQIHALSLGIVVNVLGRSTRIPTAVAQKLLKLFEMIHKRYSKIAVPPSSPLTDKILVHEADESDEQSVYAQILATLLTLFCQLSYTNNPQFIYGLLQAKDILSVFNESDKVGNDMVVASAAKTAEELRVRVAYFHALVAALPSPQQAKDILALVESVVAKGHGTTSSNTRVDLVSRVPSDCEWSAFMLPLVWELLLSSNISTVAESKCMLLEQFENLVL